MIKVGDLVRLKQNSHHNGQKYGARASTGVVVELTLDRAPNTQGDEPLDYWIKVVFLDETKATLFHDEVEIVSETK